MTMNKKDLFAKNQQSDSQCKLITEILKSGSYEDYLLRDNVLYRFVNGMNLLVIPKTMQSEMIKRVHEKGHLSGRKVESILRQDYFIPELTKKIDKVIGNCVPCILVSRKAGKKECLLNPIDKFDVPLHTYHMDHVGPLPSTAKSYKYLFNIVDGFTKFIWIYPVRSTTAKEVLKKLIMQQSVFGNPSSHNYR